ncbi:DNA gyrase/topoisomerase IV subunit A [Porphyromonas levii]|uniref:DNA gyrase/topoisomerase IV subunit A n=1 Tax=Porphyromonas levii TaxID=28114 RepID=A0A4Y8WPJ1_9PORP|nr:DNA gyrase/topoisomerase IV subunit A [Porphyromonas levii]MBR8730461.1 DNA topoisomerase 4 subunit A [Porphyromonas levii]MBR8731975.1 DNA topoisomerase 4 subunit A [Porphyromonas levii]MBR8760451.1 DNA topoisomerase 4 subunit A [Porphyromonas levii]MBR8764484.1 DNA topoisomerase 4 subunit A [Porphyromonas levii]MBR8766260.1 DNA topoisomerase 4 subunit A [Porphyromonas levii]
MKEDNKEQNPVEIIEEVEAAEESTHERNSYELRGMYRNWFLSYASYVILERAVPHIEDGLKPVQRRILYTMSRMDDRLIKVANIVGQTMSLHPHGDASIGDALVQLGQKDLLIDCQGNWGNVLTGDGAAAARYIEARLTPFAKRVLFSDKITEFKSSYDAAHEEPVSLPVKFPLLLALGAEGIAVGLSSKILPHNVAELLQACISHLKGEEFELYPDFATGGLMDISRYNDGERGGQIKVRALIEKRDARTLAITEVPFSRTTSSIIESIMRANDKGSIKIKKIDDKTAATANIEIQLPPGTSTDKTIDALYAFTDCEVSISPNCCVIRDDKPAFLNVSEVLKDNVKRTMGYLEHELRIELGELQEQHLRSSLEELFIQRRIYKDKEFEQAKDLKVALAHIRSRLADVLEGLIRPVTDEDLKLLLELRMARILRFNEEKNQLFIQGLEQQMADIEETLTDMRAYTIKWYQKLLKEYGDQYPRRTKLQSFDEIQVAKVVLKNEKLYVDREGGFIGTSLKKDEYVCDVADIDDVIVFLEDGRYMITKVADKAFVGKNILHVARWVRGDKRTIYNVIYRDGKNGASYIKRFNVNSIIRDREYHLTQEKPDSKVLYFSANPNGEAETVKVVLRPQQKASKKKLVFERDFAEILIKGRIAKGNLLTRGNIFKVTLKEQGASTLGGRKVWFDRDVFRINYDNRGEYLGEFGGEDKVLVIRENGECYTTNFSETNHFERDVKVVELYDPDKIWTLVYYDKEAEFTYIKRFPIEDSDKREYIQGEESNRIMLLSDEVYPMIKVLFGGNDEHRLPIEIDAEEFITDKSIRAKGKRISNYEVASVEELPPVRFPDPEEEEEESEEEESEVDPREDTEETLRLIEEASGQRMLDFKDEDDE